MTHIPPHDVHYLAQLSNLQLSAQEAAALQADIQSIVSYIELLSELDTTSVEPTHQVTDLHNVWREDVVDDYGIAADDLIALAPESQDGQIKVPKVLV